MKVLIVEDDRIFADLLALSLRREGFQVIHAYDGLSAVERWLSDLPDLIILDIELPKLDGFAVCQRIRSQADTPIIMLTGRQDEEDIRRGLLLGADDYITKPTRPKVVLARMYATLTRLSRLSGTDQYPVDNLSI
jgi:DNA-binding response OmpR family regulator